MTNDLFENAVILEIIEELKTNGVKFDKSGFADSREYMDKLLGHFREVTGAGDDILSDILKNDRDDLYQYIFHAGYGNGTFALAMVPMNLIYFAMLIHFPDKLEDFMSQFLYSKAPKEARKKIKQYNEASASYPKNQRPLPGPNNPKRKNASSQLRFMKQASSIPNTTRIITPYCSKTAKKGA